MPIRFRCAYCNQLMAISRRKAGTVVSCPKCAGDIIVPAPDGAAPEHDNTDRAANLAFDDADFDALLEQPVNMPPTVKAPTETAAKKEPPGESSPTMPSIQKRGVFISLRWVFVGITLGILLLILVFVLGLIVGWKAPPPA